MCNIAFDAFFLLLKVSSTLTQEVLKNWRSCRVETSDRILVSRPRYRKRQWNFKKKFVLFCFFFLRTLPSAKIRFVGKLEQEQLGSTQATQSRSACSSQGMKVGRAHLNRGPAPIGRMTLASGSRWEGRQFAYANICKAHHLWGGSICMQCHLLSKTQNRASDGLRTKCTLFSEGKRLSAHNWLFLDKWVWATQTMKTVSSLT